MTARQLLGWSHAQMTRAIAAGEIELTVTPLAKWVWREELVAKALELWPLDVIDIACARANELSDAIPGFAAALSWPVISETDHVC
jgi:hypothetical protein